MTRGRPSDAEQLATALLTRCTFPRHGPVTCAVSGGPDSLALLVLACRTGLEVTAVHVDHGLRPGSAAEAEVVASATRRFGASFESRRVAVGAGPNLEARAREARRAALPPGALTGHTADDQAETVLLQLLRGAGPRGLGAMNPDRRPLLALRRRETVELCAAFGLDPVRDPSNHDPVHARNRVRHEVLPALCDVAGRDVVPVLARAAAHQRELAAFLETCAAAVDPTDADALAAAPRLVAGEAVRGWWRQVTGLDHPPDAAAVERVLGVARGDRRATDVVAGWRVERTARRLRLVGPPASADAAPAAPPAPVPGSAAGPSR